MPKEKKETIKKRPAVKRVKKTVISEAKTRAARVKKEVEEKKAEVIIPEAVTIGQKEEAGQAKFYEGIGRRKTAMARVRLFTRGEKAVLVNDKPIQNYFLDNELDQIATSALRTMKSLDRFRIMIKVRGGGLHAQAEAIRHGSARALVLFNSDFRKRLRKAGFLTRDSRERERKKFGLKRARRAPQWSKR